MHYQSGTPRQAATTLRAKKYGAANQLAYQASERRERNVTLDAMAKTRARARARMNQRAKNGTGANAGTVGGAYLSAYGGK